MLREWAIEPERFRAAKSVFFRNPASFLRQLLITLFKPGPFRIIRVRYNHLLGAFPQNLIEF
jgi:hypothetical protein